MSPVGSVARKNSHLASSRSIAAAKVLSLVFESMADEVCALLGFVEPHVGVFSRGPPHILLDEIKAFADSTLRAQPASKLAAVYLGPGGAGLRHWPDVVNPEDRTVRDTLRFSKDRSRLHELVTTLFADVTQNGLQEGAIIDLHASEIGASLAKHGSDVSMKTSERNPIACIDHEAGPITRLALGEPGLISNLEKAGFSEHLPVIAASPEAMIQILKAWEDNHPGQKLPGSVPYSKSVIEKKHQYSHDIYLATTLEEVWVSRFQVDAALMVFILMDKNESYMVVEPANGNCGASRGYHAWLGDNLEFTKSLIAHTRTQDTPHDQNEVSFAENGVHVSQRNQQESQNEQIAQARIKEEALTIKERVLARRTATRRLQMDRETERMRLEGTPPLSSLDMVKKTRWPPQYVSPEPPKRRQHSHGTRAKARGARSSSLEIISCNPATKLRPSSVAQRCKRQQDQSAARVPKKRIVFKAAASKAQRLTLSTQEQSHALSSAALGKWQVKFHFFTTNECLGAIPVPFQDCNSMDAFFARAASACSLLNDQGVEDRIAAVYVLMEGLKFPIIVEWKNVQAYDSLMAEIAATTARSDDNLDVEVKCILR